MLIFYWTDCFAVEFFEGMFLMNSADYCFLTRYIICEYSPNLALFPWWWCTPIWVQIPICLLGFWSLRSDFFSPMTMPLFVSPMHPHGSFIVLGLIFKTWAHFELFSVCGDSRDLVSVVCRYIPQLINTIYRRRKKLLSFCQCVLLMPFSKNSLTNT